MSWRQYVFTADWPGYSNLLRPAAAAGVVEEQVERTALEQRTMDIYSS